MLIEDQGASRLPGRSGSLTLNWKENTMPLPRYKDIVDLLKQGKTAEAQEQILALREAALEQTTHP